MDLIFRLGMGLALVNMGLYFFFQKKYKIWSAKNFRYRIGRALIGNVGLFFLSFCGVLFHVDLEKRVSEGASWYGIFFIFIWGGTLIFWGTQEFSGEIYAEKYLGLVQILLGATSFCIVILLILTKIGSMEGGGLLKFLTICNHFCGNFFA